jgi:methylglyoxal synthase
MNLIILMTTKPLDTSIPTLLMLSHVYSVLMAQQRSLSRALVLLIQEKQKLCMHSQKIQFRALKE